MPLLRVMVGGREVDRRELEGPVVVGRGDQCHVRIDDWQMSREHCRLEPSRDGWLLIDLGSRNGTLVDNTPVTRHALRDGDTVRAGNVTLCFESLSAAARAFDEEVLQLLQQPDPDEDPEFDVLPVPIAPAPIIDAGPPAERAEPLQAVPIQNPPTAPAIPVTGSLQRQKSLWELADSSPSASSGKDKGRSRNSAKATRQARQARRPPRRGARSTNLAQVQQFMAKLTGPWYRHRISPALGIALALIVAVALWFIFIHEPGNGPHGGRTVVHRAASPSED